ncbi:MAG: type I 3-dehydroquinate dehydratase [Clostridia bacterium]|nr:type I 3-dehydroquinate dehydratase [Clostridia bacterium]
MKPSFLNSEQPLVTAMIQCSTPNECISKIEKSIKAGAEAIGIQAEKLKPEYRTTENLRKIFSACRSLPIYVTSYRSGYSENYTDDQCAELLLKCLDAGATLFDVMGDLYDRSPQYELTTNPVAIEKQKTLIDKIHSLGGEVLMSSHTFKSTTVEENLMIAKGQTERGADIIKIVNCAESIDEVPEYLEAILKIKAMTSKKLLFLVSGNGRIIRYIGPSFGVCMYLCVESYGSLDTPDQPLIRNIIDIRKNIRS